MPVAHSHCVAAARFATTEASRRWHSGVRVRWRASALAGSLLRRSAPQRKSGAPDMAPGSAGSRLTRGHAARSPQAQKFGTPLVPLAPAPTEPDSPQYANLQVLPRGERGDSNPRPPGPQPGALPAELRPPGSEAKCTVGRSASRGLWLHARRRPGAGSLRPDASARLGESDGSPAAAARQASSSRGASGPSRAPIWTRAASGSASGDPPAGEPEPLATGAGAGAGGAWGTASGGRRGEHPVGHVLAATLGGPPAAAHRQFLEVELGPFEDLDFRLVGAPLALPQARSPVPPSKESAAPPAPRRRG